MVSIQYIYDEIISSFAMFFVDIDTDIEQQPASKDDIGRNSKYEVYS